MNIQYPKTELFVVLGSKVYPLYVTESSESVKNILINSSRESLLTFKTAMKKNHSGLWYPDCHEEPVWTEWTVQKRAIKSYLKLPEPQVKINYGFDDEDNF
ncbi:MAG: hypothetical protein HDR41_04250 [Lactobacillus sp.]|nr:hypothetical protein [Lactobacillus sp.]